MLSYGVYLVIETKIEQLQTTDCFSDTVPNFLYKTINKVSWSEGESFMA